MRKIKNIGITFFIVITIVISMSVSVYLDITEYSVFSKEHIELIGMGTNIVVSIISLIVSIIGITISLQNDMCYGIKFSKIYLLRVDAYFRFPQLIILSILLCVLSFVNYSLEYYVGAIGVMVAALVFGIYVCCTELPLLMKDEKAIVGIIKSKMYENFKKDVEATKDLKETVKYMIINDTFSVAYDKLKMSGEKYVKYNAYLIEKILDYQSDCAFGLENLTDKKEIIETADSLTRNVFSVLFHNNKNLSQKEYEEIFKNYVYLTRVLFALSKAPYKEVRENLFYRFGDLLHVLSYDNEDKTYTQNVLHFVAIMVVSSLKAGELGFVKSVRRYYSVYDYTLEKDEITTVLFAFISLYLYYLSFVESSYPKDLKKKVDGFIDEDGLIDDTIITSWRNLFDYMHNRFPVKYEDFFKLYKRCGGMSLQYTIYSGAAYSVSFTDSFVSNWYFATLLNSDAVYSFDNIKFQMNKTQDEFLIINFLECCFKEDEFAPDDNILNVVNFYVKEDAFYQINIDKKISDNIFEHLNSLKMKNVLENTRKSKLMENATLEEELCKFINDSICIEYGYDNSLSVSDEERYFCLLQEKFAETSNFKDVIFNSFVKGIKNDIYNHIKHEIIYKTQDFSIDIEKVIKKSWFGISTKRKELITHLIKDPVIKEQFNNKVNSLAKIESAILKNLTFISKDGFSFNFELVKVEVRDMNTEELSEQVEKHKRKDGQYIYDGVFMSQEKIAEVLKSRYAIFLVVFKHSVKLTDSGIVEICPFEKI